MSQNYAGKLWFLDRIRSDTFGNCYLFIIRGHYESYEELDQIIVNVALVKPKKGTTTLQKSDKTFIKLFIISRNS